MLIKEREGCLIAPGILTQGLSLTVDPATQTLKLYKDQNLTKEYIISTAAKGLGEQKNSYMTPRGWHIIRAKIGAACPVNAVFNQRRFKGEIYTPELQAQDPRRDWILSRILWLSGLQLGFNRLGNVDTMQRYIYIHGTPDDRAVGTPTSRGCIRMRNQDIIELFDLVPIGTKIYISDAT